MGFWPALQREYASHTECQCLTKCENSADLICNEIAFLEPLPFANLPENGSFDFDVELLRPLLQGVLIQCAREGVLSMQA